MSSLNCFLHQGDCIDVMKTLPDKAAHCVITDPPFNSTDCHWDTPFDLGAWWEHINRVLADCEAKRRIVEVATAHGTLQSIEILSLLALPYADHPDYQEDWRP